MRRGSPAALDPALKSVGIFNQRASYFQAGPNKTKQKSLDLLGFIWFYLVESGLFKGLRAKK